ncbi:MAG TPA: HAMP domain-containing sensor histidine kinase [Solirubrobacteraceae bacterium]|nr:HAMP domain-containing sensor histidine kinase [Solirubrobacteraceae bacterium]
MGALAIAVQERRRRAAVDALRAELSALRRRTDDERRRTADAVHALRGPLTVMGAEVDVYLREEGVAPAARELLASVREEVDAMSRIVANLLTVAAIDEHRLRLNPVPVVLLDAIETAARPFRRAAAAKRLTLQLGGERCQARADPERLQQALGNLIDNAIKYTEPGGDVSVTAWCAAGQAGVTVTDSGPGISAAARAHLFERYYREPARANSRGSGLGLAICREIITAHGGSVWVDSEEGRGSAFTLALPRSAGAAG